MNRRKYFFTGLIIMVILGALDLLTTYLGTPDLVAEANAFVSVYGFDWTGVILTIIGFVCFVTIPFYYHCLVFNYPVYNEPKQNPFIILRDYFFRNHRDALTSFLKAGFNILGYFLFWFYCVNKLAAVTHNTLLLTVDSYSHVSFATQIRTLDLLVGILLTIMMIIFFVSIIIRANKKNRRLNTRSMHVVPVLLFFLLIISFWFFRQFAKPVHLVERANGPDPDITLINIEEGDREFIGKLLLKIDSLKPAVIAIHAYFKGEKEPGQDSVLIAALARIPNEILSYGIDSSGNISNSHPKFRSLVKAEGIVSFGKINGLVSRFVPVRIKDSVEHEELALKVVKSWIPGFRHSLKPNQKIPIKFRRTIREFLVIYGSDIDHVEPGLITNKIVILGYLGPADEDRRATPFRLYYSYPQFEDSYSTVIIANEIRTILDYKK